MSQTQSFCDILSDLKEAEHGEETSIGDIVKAFKYRGFGPLLMIPSLLVIIPVIGAIPGASILGAVIIFLICIQMVIGRESPWIPSRLERITFNGNTLEKGVEKAEPAAAWVDRYTRPRLTFLVTNVMKRMAALICIVLAGLLVPLAALPMGVSIPAAAVLFFALALTVNDGLVMLLALLITAGTFIGAAYWLI